MVSIAIYVYKHMCIYGCTHKDTIHVFICTCEYVCVSVCMCLCRNIYTILYIHSKNLFRKYKGRK